MRHASGAVELYLCDLLRPLTAFALCVFGLVAGIAGCGQSGPGRVALSGVVTLDSQPLPDGEIVFSPTQSGGYMATAQIQNGEFQIPAEYGPSEGMYVVQITAFKNTGKAIAANPLLEDDAPTETIRQYIPARYNDQSELTLTVDPGVTELTDLSYALDSSNR